MDNRNYKQVNRNRQMAQRLANRGIGHRPTGADATAHVAGGRMGNLPQGFKGEGAQGLTEKFEQGILQGFKPGNIGEINNVLWPFYFQFTTSDLVPGASLPFNFSVTQEAAFIMRQVSQVTFRKVGTDYEYIDPFYYDESANSPNGLVFTMEDAQSSRVFNGRTPEEISMLGNANYPKIYPSTIFLLPNQTMLLNVANTNTVETYRTYVTVLGYRVRVKDAQSILSTVTG